jgi:hypothetical protein
MSNWFFASNGQQQGPYPEAQFRDLIARGMVTTQTLVWREGMAGWQKAGDIPGLLAGAGAPPAMPTGGGPVMSSGGYAAGGSLSVDFGIWDFTWRSIVFFLGLITVIPTPWVVCWYTNWLVSNVHVPGRPNLSFTGRPGTIALWYFGWIVIVIIIEVIATQADSQAFSNVANIVQLVLYWLFLKYLIANLASNGQPLGLAFSGSFWGYFGWNLLLGLSILTIVGWAWVYPPYMRWIYRNIQGTRRQITFKGTGLEVLWRMIVAALGSMLIIPIPWVSRWMMRWFASQTELVERGSVAA